MKTIRFLTTAIVMFIVLESCGPVVFTTRMTTPPPPWFYPNRIETVRYVYFPDHYIYYDLSLNTYLYLDNNVWISTRILPARYNAIDLRRSRFTRINNYFGDNIGRYHSERRSNTRRNRTTTRRKK